MKVMTTAEHLAMLEEQQRALALRARSADASEFHRALAERYARLIAEIGNPPPQ